MARPPLTIQRPEFLADLGPYPVDHKDYTPETEALIRLLLFSCATPREGIDLLRGVPAQEREALVRACLDRPTWDCNAENGIPLLREPHKGMAAQTYLLRLVTEADAELAVSRKPINRRTRFLRALGCAGYGYLKGNMPPEEFAEFERKMAAVAQALRPPSSDLGPEPAHSLGTPTPAHSA